MNGVSTAHSLEHLAILLRGLELAVRPIEAQHQTKKRISGLLRHPPLRSSCPKASDHQVGCHAPSRRAPSKHCQSGRRPGPRWCSKAQSKGVEGETGDQLLAAPDKKGLGHCTVEVFRCSFQCALHKVQEFNFANLPKPPTI